MQQNTTPELGVSFYARFSILPSRHVHMQDKIFRIRLTNPKDIFKIRTKSIYR